MKNLLLLFVFLCSVSFAQTTSVAVKADSVTGPFTLLNGVNCGPYGQSDGRNYTSELKSFGIKAVRAHDYYGPCDWSTIFQNWNNHPDSASSYNFRTSDTAIARIINAGMQVLFRLGNSYRGSGAQSLVDPPGTIRDGSNNITHAADTNDFKKFAIICKRIVMHYNDGWAGGYRYNIKKWEIWNEPANPVQFWSGTYDQFRQMFAIVAKELKSYNSTLMVGGPAQAGNVTDAPYNDSLVAYCSRVGAPIDFYSWHWYMSSQQILRPYQFVSKAIQFRAMLNRYGYTSTVQYCDEWNAGTGGPLASNYVRGAVYAASALSYLNDVVAESYFYRGDYHPLGLFDSTGSARKITDGFKMYNYVVTNGNRLSASGTDTLGFTSLASRSDDGRTVRVMVSNYTASARQTTITINGLNALPAGSLRQIHYVIDTTNRFAKTDSVLITRNSSVSVTLSVGAYTAHLYEFKIENTTDISSTEQPSGFSLMQNYPNPFNPSTVFTYSIPEGGPVSLLIYDILGKEAAVLVNEVKAAGTHSVAFNGATLPAGVYFYKLSCGKYSAVKKLTLLK